MTMMQEILNWADGLPAWQSDAVGRLLIRRRKMREQLAESDRILELDRICRNVFGINFESGGVKGL